jgi:hypothetical protein
MFDSGQIARDHRAPDRDRLLIARLDVIAAGMPGGAG